MVKKDDKFYVADEDFYEDIADIDYEEEADKDEDYYSDGDFIDDESTMFFFAEEIFQEEEVLSDDALTDETELEISSLAS